jgi:hypothetical protein
MKMNGVNDPMRQFTCYRTEDLGFILLILYSESDSSVIYLVDPWKIGILDCFLFKGDLDNIRQEMNMPDLEFTQIEMKNAKYFIALGKRIAVKIGKSLNSDAETWIEKLKTDRIVIKGSIYKCFSCETGDLDQKEDEDIIRIAKRELKRKVAGTAKEKQYYYICKECKDKLHKTHTV